jgi:hypothetical protein
VAKNDETARCLLSGAASQIENVACYWDIFPENAPAVALAQALGFSRVRTLTRMALGAEIPEVTKYIYGIAGFEIG